MGGRARAQKGRGRRRGDSSGRAGGREPVGGRAHPSQPRKKEGGSFAATEGTARISRQVEDGSRTSRALSELEARLRPVRGAEAAPPVAFSGVRAPDLLLLDSAQQGKGDSEEIGTH